MSILSYWIQSQNQCTVCKCNTHDRNRRRLQARFCFTILYRLQVMYVQQLGDTCVSQSSMYVWRRHHMLKTFLNAYIHTQYIHIQYIHSTYLHTYILNVLWGQPIKLTQVASTSELLENPRNDLVFFKIIPSHFCRASEASKIDCFKN